MRHVAISLFMATLPIAGCSLFVSLDGLSSGDDSTAPKSDASAGDAAIDASRDAASNDASKSDAGFDAGDGAIDTTALCVAHTHCWPFDGSGTVPPELVGGSGELSIVASGKSLPNALMAKATTASSGFNGNAYYTAVGAFSEAHVYASFFFSPDPTAPSQILPAYYLRLGLYAPADADRCEFYLRIGPPGASVDNQTAMLVLPHADTTTDTIPVPSTGVLGVWNDVRFEVVKDGSGLHLDTSINGAVPTVWNDTTAKCFSGGDAYFYAGLSEVATGQTVLVDDLSFDLE